MNNREYDELVAEKIMGLSGFYWMSGDLHYGDRYRELVVSNYTTNLQDAWEVVIELRKKQIYIDVNTQTLSVKAYSIESDDTPPYHYRNNLASEQCESIEMSDLPLKICLAAIKVIEFKKD